MYSIFQVWSGLNCILSFVFKFYAFNLMERLDFGRVPGSFQMMNELCCFTWSHPVVLVEMEM